MGPADDETIRVTVTAAPEAAAAASAPPAHRAAPLIPGAGFKAVFPRMAGKRRPGVVVHACAAGVIALPLTTRRTNQPGHFPMPDAEIVALGFEKRAHLLLPRAAYLPQARCEPASGALSERLLAQILGEMVDWYGLDWRERAPTQDPDAARLLHLRARP